MLDRATEIDMYNVFDEDDKSTFKSLNTRTSQLLSDLRPCPNDMQTRIKAYAERIRRYTFSRPESTGASKRPFTRSLERNIVQQATPSVMSFGCALITTIGQDLDIDDHDETKFVESELESPKYVRACYNYMNHWEKTSGTLDVDAAKRMTEAGYIPYVGVFPWFRSDTADTVFASRLLLAYLKTTKPLIVLAHGPLPTYLAFWEFEGDLDYLVKYRSDILSSPDECVGSVGEPMIRKFGSTGEEFVLISTFNTDFPTEGRLLSNIEGIHKSTAIRLCLYSHAIAWFAMGVALRCDRDTSRSWSRREICQAVVQEVQRITRYGCEFGDKFNPTNDSALDDCLSEEAKELRQEAYDFINREEGSEQSS